MKISKTEFLLLLTKQNKGSINRNTYEIDDYNIAYDNRINIRTGEFGEQNVSIDLYSCDDKNY